MADDAPSDPRGVERSPKVGVLGVPSGLSLRGCLPACFHQSSDSGSELGGPCWRTLKGSSPDSV